MVNRIYYRGFHILDQDQTAKPRHEWRLSSFLEVKRLIILSNTVPLDFIYSFVV
jgi:hypothetical protein